MRGAGKIVTVLVLAGAVAATLALRESRRGSAPGPGAPATVVVPTAGAPAGAAAPAPAPETGAVQAASAAPGAAPTAASGRPRLLELGSMRCMACQEMAKVLEALRASQGERLAVDFIDVFEQPEAGDRYGLKLIPTQILYDAQGREIFRHIGYFSHDDVLAKFRELGVKL